MRVKYYGRYYADQKGVPPGLNVTRDIAEPRRITDSESII